MSFEEAKINDEELLMIHLPRNTLQPVRQTNIEAFRERTSEEKYYLQSINIFCKESDKKEDSGFVQLNDYTDMCKMIRVLPKYKKCLHAFDRWEHYGNDFFKTDKFNIRDLTTFNYVEECYDLPTNMSCNDLKKDEDYLYSKVLLECLNEYSEANTPENIRSIREKYKQTKEMCSCRLFEYLDIQDAFYNNMIGAEEKTYLMDNLNCNCSANNFVLETEPSEEEKSMISEMRLKAQAEIAGMFVVKALDKVKSILEQNLYYYIDPYDGVSIIKKEIQVALGYLEKIFLERQKTLGIVEIERTFIEEEAAKFSKQILATLLYS